MNKVYMGNCTLNRFDIHCYGCDVTCECCTFQNTHVNILDTIKHNFNRLSCFYGDFYYKECTFNDFRPLLIDSSFHIYTGFNLILDRCHINTGANSDHMIEIGQLTDEIAIRPEHSQKCWPNLIVKELTIKPLPGYRAITDEPQLSRHTYALFNVIGDIDYHGTIKYMNLLKFTITSGSVPYDLVEVINGQREIPTGILTTEHNLQRNLNFEENAIWHYTRKINT